MDGGAWWAAVHGVAKSWTWLSDFPFTFHFHALKKEMATNSGVLAWRIPGTGEPGGLPSMGSQRVGHDWSDLAAPAAAAQHTENWSAIKCFTYVDTLLRKESWKQILFYLINKGGNWILARINHLFYVTCNVISWLWSWESVTSVVHHI